MKWTVGSITQISQAKIPFFLQLYGYFKQYNVLGLQISATADLYLFAALWQSATWGNLSEEKIENSQKKNIIV